MIRYAVLFLILCSAFQLRAQDKWFAGVGLSYASYVNNPGINISLTVRLPYEIFIGPDFSALLNSERQEQGQLVKRKEIEANFNVHKLFSWGTDVSIYPLTGLNFARITRHAEGDDPQQRWVISLNLGGGVELELRKFNLFLEAKYARSPDRVDVAGGLIIPIFKHGSGR